MIGRAGGLEEFRLASEVTIGKSLTSDVRLTDPSVGSRHARVFSRDGTAFYIEDLDSKNGTFVNGDPVPSGVPVKLLPGDNIKIGEVEMTFERT
jgi:pSer/pThr/pTyr-binding forkhead associated (FHA) protein